MKKKLVFIFISPLLVIFLSYYSAYSTTIVLHPKDAACNNNNGSITVGVSGGLPPYTYQWSSGQTVRDISNLAPGIYHLFVTDSNAATDSASVTIGNTSSLTSASLNFLPGIFPCTNQCNGTGFLGVSNMNGTPPYTLSTSPLRQIGTYFNGTSYVPAALGVCSDDVFTAYATDALGCTGIVFQTPHYSPTSFNFTSEIKGACSGLPNGSAKLTFTNYNPGSYHASFAGPSPGQFSNITPSYIFSPLLSGIYTVTITNSWAPNCDTVFTLNITDLGTNCGLLSGRVYLDSTNNCLSDSAEPGLPYQLIRFTPGPYYTFSDTIGNYNAWLPFDNYTVETINDPHFTNVCRATGVNLTLANDTISGVDIGDSTGTDLDLSIHMVSSSARPGNNFTLYIHAINHSYIPASNPEAIIDYGSVLTFLNASVPFTNTGTSQVTLTLPSIGSFSSCVANLNFSIPANPGLIGSLLSNMVTLNANQPEPNQSNNADVLNQIITGSYDPNEKSVWPAADPLHHYFLSTDSIFRYTIRFQNTGNDTAFKVVLVDSLNPYLDITSFQFLGSSHPCKWELTGRNILQVHYTSINLPDSNINEPASHGLFSFSIKPSASLQSVVLPYVLENRAAIYFDINPSVITDPAFNTIELNVGISKNDQQNCFVLTNPAHEYISIHCGDLSKIDHLQIIDLLGRQKKSFILNSTVTNIPLDNMESGVYLVRVYGKSGSGCIKFIKL